MTTEIYIPNRFESVISNPELKDKPLLLPVEFADNVITIRNKIWINFPSICHIKIALPLTNELP